jgi:hypothetical protein
MQPLGEDVSEQLARVAAAFKVIRTIRRKAVCPCCHHFSQPPMPMSSAQPFLPVRCCKRVVFWKEPSPVIELPLSGPVTACDADAFCKESPSRIGLLCPVQIVSRGIQKGVDMLTRHPFSLRPDPRSWIAPSLAVRPQKPVLPAERQCNVYTFFMNSVFSCESRPASFPESIALVMLSPSDCRFKRVP